MAGSRRLPQLDALRGIAAAVVVLFHWVACVPAFAQPSGVNVWSVLARTPARVIVAGEEAVILFFLLSGFVLALPFVDGHAKPYGRFLISRACRLYPAAWVTAGATLGIVALLGPMSIPQAEWAQHWDLAPTVASAFQHATLLLPSREIAHYDIPLWSLVQELRVSLLFPLLAAAVLRRAGGRTLGLAVLTTVLVSFAATRVSPVGPGGTSIGATLVLLTPFVAGIELARRRDQIRQAVSNAPRSAIALAAVAALAIMPLDAYIPGMRPAMTALGLQILVPTLSGAVLVAIALRPSVARALCNRPTLFLGRVSYSLYLVHVPILLLLLKATGGPPTLGLAVAGIAASFALAALTYRYVERPGIALGKRLAQRVGHPRAIPAPEAA